MMRSATKVTDPVHLCSRLTAAVGGAFTMLAFGIALSGCQKQEPSESQARLRPYELLDVMHQFQTYADKLYFSGQALNWELAAWYCWKIEAAALPVIEGQVEPYRTERLDAQPTMKTMLIPALRSIEQAIEKKNESEFMRAYSGLVDTCNGCHVALEHAFVKIVVPSRPAHSNQNYAP
jgi:hypothetical protein